MEYLHPKFIEAGEEMKRIAREEGDEALRKPEHAHLFRQFFEYAPESFHTQAEAMAKEMGLMPPVRHVDDSGAPVYSIEEIAQHHGMSVEEAEKHLRLIDKDSSAVYTGPVFPVQ